jgi:aspartyl-tRNA(Asn)/glutamyl-tRNA(Gln) amidotransferase subunit A
VAGLKVTAGLVDLSGVIPLSKTCDTAGLMGRSVTDICVLLEALAQGYPKNAVQPRFRNLRKNKPRRFRLGWPEQHFFDNVDEEVRRRINEAMKCFQSLGATIKKVSLPHLAESVEAGTTIQMAEATRYHQSQGYFPELADEYGADVRQRLGLGLQVHATDYLRAFDTKRLVEAEFDATFQHVDAIVAPASPIPAPPIGLRELEIDGKQQPVRPLLVNVNRPANVSGSPALSIPCGFTNAGLPVGLQLIGPRWGEAGLLAIALSYEDATDWHKRHPV